MEMAEPGDELLEGDLGDGEYNELDADEEEALLADDNGYSGYNLPSARVSAHRDVYISASPDSKTSRKIKVEDVEDVAEGDEILDDEDVLELGVEGNWNLDDLDSESQDQGRKSERNKSLWIKQERVDPLEIPVYNEPDEVEEEPTYKQDISPDFESNQGSVEQGIQAEELPHKPSASIPVGSMSNFPHDISSLSQNSEKKTVVITSSADISQSHLNDDEDDDDHERRDRFKSERSLPDSVITTTPTKHQGQKSTRGVGTVGRGGPSPGRFGTNIVGRGGSRQAPDGPPHKVLINPHFKGANPTPQYPQSNAGNAYRDAHQAQSHFDQPGHQFPKQQEYQSYQPPTNSQFPPHPQHHYQEPVVPTNATGLHKSPAPGPHYQNAWQNAVGPQQQQIDQHNHPGYYQGPPAPPPASWNPPGQPGYHDYNHRPPHQLPHQPHQPPHHQPPHHQSPHHQPPHHQPPHHQPHHHQRPLPHPPQAMRPEAPNLHHLVSEQEPPPPGLESEFQSRKVQFSHENKNITIQMYSESAPGDIRRSQPPDQFGNNMAPPPHPPPPGQYFNQRPGPFQQQGPPRPFFPPQHQPYPPPQESFGMPGHQQPPRLPFPPSPQHLHPQRFPPRFKRGGFQRGGFTPQFRHPMGPRPMQPSPNVMFNPRLQNYQPQPIKRSHPEPQIPHQPPFKQMRPNLNFADVGAGQLSNKGKLTIHRERNLLEVQTVDNVPDTTTCSDQGIEEDFDEDDDEETRQYKRKIAEQKRLREKLLQEKEERRKLAAVAKQKEIEQRKLSSQNTSSSQTVHKPQNPAHYESGQLTINVSGQTNDGNIQGNRISVHKRIGLKVSPVKRTPVASTQITVFNEHQPTAFKIVRVRTKDGTVLIKKLPINSAGQVLIQRPTQMPPPTQVVHHQPVPPRQLLLHNNPHHHPPPLPTPTPHPPQHPHNYPQQPLAPGQPPPPPQHHNQYFHPNQNQQYQQPQLIQEPHRQQLYQQPEQHVQPPPIMHVQNPGLAANSKRIVVNRPPLQGANGFKPNRPRVRPGPFKKPNASSNMSSVITIVPVSKNMTLGQRFTLQNQQLKKDQSQQQQQQQKQEQKLPVQAQSGTKSNRTVINSVMSAGTPTSKIPLPPGPVTNKVVVDNLTAGTSRQQLVGMAEQVGEVKILTLDTSQKRATITFNNTKAATAFYQKFQRKMVNLSMINVSFVSE